MRGWHIGKENRIQRTNQQGERKETKKVIERGGGKKKTVRKKIERE